jgi:hypothetical protein
VSFAAITLYVASQRVFVVVYFVIDSVWKLLDTPTYMGRIRLDVLCCARCYPCNYARVLNQHVLFCRIKKHKD